MSFPKTIISMMTASVAIGTIGCSQMDSDPLSVQTSPVHETVGVLNMRWQKLPGSAIDMGVGQDGTAWIVSKTPCGAAGNYLIMEWDGSQWKPDISQGYGVRIDVDKNGYPWVVRKDGNVFSRNTHGWIHRGPSGKATDIGISSNGDVWIIGAALFKSDNHADADSNYGVYRYRPENDGWVQDRRIEGIRLDVDAKGRPWVVQRDGKVYARNEADPCVEQGVWELQPGRASDIGAGGSSGIWCLGRISVKNYPNDFRVYTRSSAGWDEYNGGGVNISVGPNKMPWVVNSKGEVFMGY